MKTLAPVLHKDQYTERVEKEILAYLRETIFEPLFDILEAAGLKVRRNDLDALRAALDSGQVWYADGAFTGAFNAAVSWELRKLGASKTERGFELGLPQVPIGLRTAIAASKAKSEALHQEVSATLAQMQENLLAAPTGLSFRPAVDAMVADMQNQFAASVAKGDIGVPAQLTPEIAAAMDRNLTNAADRRIKGFTAEEIPALRVKVQQNLYAGGRADRLEGLIEAQYGVSKRRARFIAENETSLAVSQFREERYKSIGCTRYIWSTSHDEKVRLDHRLLDGREFEFDNPPVCDRATGFRGNPGVAANCRCVAIPVLSWDE